MKRSVKCFLVALGLVGAFGLTTVAFSGTVNMKNVKCTPGSVVGTTKTCGANTETNWSCTGPYTTKSLICPSNGQHWVPANS